MNQPIVDAKEGMKEKVTKVELTTTAKNLDSQESTKARPIMPAVLKGNLSTQQGLQFHFFCSVD